MEQVRTWGLFWRPCEIDLARFPDVVDAIIRLHNYCRRRRDDNVPASIGVSQPAKVSFDKDNFFDGDFFNTGPIAGRRPGGKGGPREAIRARLERESILRPRWNLERNAARLDN